MTIILPYALKVEMWHPGCDTNKVRDKQTFIVDPRADASYSVGAKHRNWTSNCLEMLFSDIAFWAHDGSVIKCYGAMMDADVYNATGANWETEKRFHLGNVFLSQAVNVAYLHHLELLAYEHYIEANNDDSLPKTVKKHMEKLHDDRVDERVKWQKKGEKEFAEEFLHKFVTPHQ